MTGALLASDYRRVTSACVLVIYAGAMTWVQGVGVIPEVRIVLAALLLAIACIDADTRTIPNRAIGAVVALWIVHLAPLGVEGGLGAALEAATLGLRGALAVGAGLLVLVVLLEALTRAEGMGGGDIKLMAACSLFLGAWHALIALMVACMLGAGVAVAQAVRSGASEALRGKTFAFGPFIAVGVMLAMLAA